MKQVVQSARSGKLEVKEVPAPQVAPGHLLVRTRASLISAGTERMVVDFARKSLAGKAKARPDLVEKVLTKARTDGIAQTFQSVMARLDQPLPLGYSAAGVVTEVGEGLEGRFRVGERVAIAGAGLANHAEVNVVPAALCAKIPDGVADAEACYGTLGAIALHAVRNLGAGLGDIVAVIGAGLVGQLAVQFLSLAGARVVALDFDETRLALAAEAGAELTLRADDAGLVPAVSAMTDGRGCDAVLIAAASDDNGPFVTAADIARDRARVCLVGMSGTAFPYADFMKKELSVIVSRSYGPGRYDADFENRGVKYPDGFVRWTETANLAECLRLMARARKRRLRVANLTTHKFAIDEATEAYALVTQGEQPHLGVVLTYDEKDESAAGASAVTQFPAPAKLGDGRCVLGVIGAGNFARAVLLPELRKLTGVELHTIATRKGAGAEHEKNKHGFAHATTDTAAVIANPEINAVVVATRHDSHATLTADALHAGKAVLVEKPLGLTRADIETVAAARRESQGFFQVGFNRRFAPMAVAARTHLAAAPGPKVLVLRVNAGGIPPESWVHDPEDGGGRILGEACHFVDLARFLVGAEIASVGAEAAKVTAGACDDATITLNFKDGSLATIAYTALGDAAYPKERFEAYGGGTVVEIDNFRVLTVTRGGRTTTSRAGSGDKGFAAALRAFADAVAQGGPAPVDEPELIETSLATIAAMESLRTGQRVTL